MFRITTMVSSGMTLPCLVLCLWTMLSSCTASRAVSVEVAGPITTCAFLGRMALNIVHWRQYNVPLSTVYAVAPKHAAAGVRQGILDNGGLTSQRFLLLYTIMTEEIYTQPAIDLHAMRREVERLCFAAWPMPEATMQWIKQ